MRSIGCFWCPQRDYSKRELHDPCPVCGRRFDAPLTNPPDRIGNFKIREPIARGFYGATYRAEQTSLQRTVVLKVVPVDVYRVHKKDWQQECVSHGQVSRNNPFVADITDQFDADIEFGDGTLRCHVAVLENLTGATLEQVLQAPAGYALTPRMAAQIAADLFEIMGSLAARERFHNDLHSENIIVHTLESREKRSAEAFDPYVTAVAIDLGSMSDESRSGEGERINDQHHVAKHLARLADAVRISRKSMSDVDFRIAETLRGLAEHLSPSAGAVRTMSADDARDRLRAAMQTVDEPWRQPLVLRRFGDAQNAQVLESWHVPELWLDPDDRWFARTTGRGPQVITGMRGCGKTMLLRALHFHARAKKIAAERPESIAERLRADGFVGLFASGQKLLNPKDAGSASPEVSSPFERLYVAYLRDAIQVLQHLRSLDETALNGPVEQVLQEALRVLDGPPVNASTPQQLDQALAEIQFGLADGTITCRLRTSPSEAFGHLAKVVRNASPVFADAYVLFLLDDVSSRYLPINAVRDVISSLLFQQPTCAFRITTEAQALHRALLSPGGIAPADPTRDYEEVDLGNEVFRILQEGSARERVDFIAGILSRRAKQLGDEWSNLPPRDVLGEVTLAEIAREIVQSSATSNRRKAVYRGIRALLAVCVGDIGDVVKLYEKIIQRGDARVLPVPANIQTNCFLEHSAGLMHVINRRQQHHKDLAIAFAQAASELMHRSAKEGKDDGRLRQYTKLYVRVDSGDDAARERIFDLLDAGVFVYDGGAPRTKTRDDDPVLQFKLSYRKMLGLASYIGLSHRDRFELSGEKLHEFLFNASAAKAILLESEAGKPADALGGDALGEDEEPARVEAAFRAQHAAAAERSTKATGLATPSSNTQLSLLDGADAGGPNNSENARRVETTNAAGSEFSVAPRLTLRSTVQRLEEWRDSETDAVVVALGFEERALESAKRVLATVRPRRVVTVRYTPDDQGRDIDAFLREYGAEIVEVSSPAALREICTGLGPNTIVDSTGLSKPYLFCAVRELLVRGRAARIVHTLAERHYPRNEDLERIGVGDGEPVSGEIFSRLEEVLTGEEAPYALQRVHAEPATPERARALLASVSPKNDRLFHLLDERTYDAVRILVPRPTSARRRFARAAAELAASIAEANTQLVDVDTNDLHEALEQCTSLYRELYFDLGMNVELGLTGSKIHAVACAALSAVGRVSYAWYVVPGSFDRQRFTEGVGDTQCYRVEWVGDASLTRS